MRSWHSDGAISQKLRPFQSEISHMGYGRPATGRGSMSASGIRTRWLLSTLSRIASSRRYQSDRRRRPSTTSPAQRHCKRAERTSSRLAVELAHLSMGAPGAAPTTSVSLFDQGLVQVLQAAVTGLEPKSPYVLAFSTSPEGIGTFQPLAAFITNPAGGAIVNSVGPIRQLVSHSVSTEGRYLVIAPGQPDNPGKPVQIQVP